MPAPAFIHPLLDADDKWSGFLVDCAPGVSDPAALAHLATSPWRAHFVGQSWFVPAFVAHAPALTGDDVALFPAQPELGEEALLRQREEELRRNGQALGLLASPKCRLPGTGTWRYLLVGAAHARTLPPYTLTGLAVRSTVVATQVYSYQDRDWALRNGCALTSDEFLLTFSAGARTADTTRLKLLELLALLADDANTAALDSIFRQEAKLSYSLLRLVNSAAIAPRQPITSFAQAINLLGRRQLQRWLQLLVYADSHDPQRATPLLPKAAARGRLLELLAPQLGPGVADAASGDAAFMIGTFSLLDVLLNMPMQDILLQLPLPDIARAALATRSGPLGQLLNAVDAAESGTTKSAASKLAELGISGEAYIDAQLQALGWAAQIRIDSR